LCEEQDEEEEIKCKFFFCSEIFVKLLHTSATAINKVVVSAVPPPPPFFASSRISHKLEIEALRLEQVVGGANSSVFFNLMMI
jgi:hypothetical protein